MAEQGILLDPDLAFRESWEQKTYEEIKKHTYIDPLYDAGFKAFLNDEQAMISFLNGVFHLEGDKRIVSATLKNTEINIIFPQVKSFRLDIRATTSNGFSVNVEMQKAKHSRFIERILLQHSAFMIQSKYEWDKEFLSEPKCELSEEERARRDELRYEIPPTFAIWICDFPVEKQEKYRGTWAIRNERGLTVTDKVKYILYDLTRFNKKLDSIRTTEERWLYLLKHAGKADCLPDFDDSVISDAIKRLLVNSAPDKLIREQARDMVLTEEELDHLAAMKVRARREGLAEGRAEGRAEGLAEGESNGIDKSLDVFRSLGVSDETLEKASQILANSKN
ncbi:MAG: PD-(D/E)XK nuclease family transposase [Fibrobacter sp.]|nr:PD-(D/E)XK nuclease family transposase [Fibrobacter sp.]